MMSAPQNCPVDSKARKGGPVFSGLLNYFPKTAFAVAVLSRIGNDKHNPGQPLHWARGKSDDHDDCVIRHTIDIGTIDPDDGIRHAVKRVWRAMAACELEIERALAEGKPVFDRADVGEWGNPNAKLGQPEPVKAKHPPGHDGRDLDPADYRRAPSVDD